MPTANIEGPKFPLLRQLAHAVRQRAVSVFLHRFKAAKERWTAQEHSGIESVVTGKVFADLDHVISFAADFGCIVEVKNAIKLRIDREDDLILREGLLHQSAGRFRLENVVRHQQQEWLVEFRFCSPGRGPSPPSGL